MYSHTNVIFVEYLSFPSWPGLEQLTGPQIVKTSTFLVKTFSTHDRFFYMCSLMLSPAESAYTFIKLEENKREYPVVVKCAAAPQRALLTHIFHMNSARCLHDSNKNYQVIFRLTLVKCDKILNN